MAFSKPSLFEQFNIPTKRQVFEKDLKIKILNRELTSDVDVYLYSLSEGFLPKDANKILKGLKDSLQIDYDFKPISSRVHKIEHRQLIKLK